MVIGFVKHIPQPYPVHHTVHKPVHHVVEKPVYHGHHNAGWGKNTGYGGHSAGFGKNIGFGGHNAGFGKNLFSEVGGWGQKALGSWGKNAFDGDLEIKDQSTNKW